MREGALEGEGGLLRKYRRIPSAQTERCPADRTVGGGSCAAGAWQEAD